MIDDVVRDLRYAWRMFRRAPGFVAAAVLSLALGIGANTALFSIVDRLMFRPLPVSDPSRLFVVRSGQNFSVDYAMFERLREGAPGVADLAAVIRTDRYNVGIGSSVEPFRLNMFFAFVESLRSLARIQPFWTNVSCPAGLTSLIVACRSMSDFEARTQSSTAPLPTTTAFAVSGDDT